MSASGDPPERKPIPILDLGIVMAGQVGLATVLIVLAAALGGAWLDRTLDTRPLFTIVLVLASAPVSLYVAYRLAMAMAARMPMPPGKMHRVEDNHEED